MAIRRLFENKEGYCDECGQALTRTKDNKFLRYKKGDMVICQKCYHERPPKPLKEREHFCFHCGKDINEMKITKKRFHSNNVYCVYCYEKIIRSMKRERKNWLKSLPPEEFIKIVENDY